MLINVLLTWFTLFSITFSATAFSLPSGPGSTSTFFLFYLALVGFFIFQKTILSEDLAVRKKRLFFNLQLSFFTVIYYYFFEIQDFLFTSFPNSNYLSFYTLILACPYLFLNVFFHAYLNSKNLKNFFSEAFNQVRFLGPFVLLHLFFLLISDFFLQQNSSNHISIFLSVGFFLFCSIFFPFLVVTCWSKKGLENNNLENTLKNLCKNLKFQYSSLRTWNQLKNSTNAAILGIFSFSRFILFSPSLLQSLKEEEVQAILCHEIAHQKKKHLLFYPLVLLIGFLIINYLTQVIFYPLTPFFELYFFYKSWSLSTHLTALTNLALSFLMFLLYFRTFFGFVSRNFERQADSFIFQSPIAPKHLQNALLKASSLNGEDPSLHNWHHYGIQERVDFIEKCKRNPNELEKHENKIKKIKRGIFCTLLLLTLTGLSFTYETPAFTKKIRLFWEQIQSKKLEKFKKNIASELIQKYELQLETLDKGTFSLQTALNNYGVTKYPGLFEYYSALYLFNLQEPYASLQMLHLSWKKIDPKVLKQTSFGEFKGNSIEILDSLKEDYTEQVNTILNKMESKDSSY
ncbi:Uncharacterized protein AB751O23_BS_00030 [Chlamydiales bacterium SCGC AB-751-O23]|jgi:Zn-dependent protease with chaperone function|nr:Uncharacterized protein AB751O23_BS_00030 [Chlamydiales bacterium SCGC AB-751-O23]